MASIQKRKLRVPRASRERMENGAKHRDVVNDKNAGQSTY